MAVQPAPIKKRTEWNTDIPCDCGGAIIAVCIMTEDEKRPVNYYAKCDDCKFYSNWWGFASNRLRRIG